MTALPHVAVPGESLHLALYHPWVYLTGGAERVLLELMDRSRHRWTLYTHHHDPAGTFEGFSNHEVHELSPRVSVDRSLRPLAHAAASMLRTRLPIEGVDGLLVSSEGFGDLVLARTAVPAAVYCHTPLKILHDDQTREALVGDRPGIGTALNVLGPAFSAVDQVLWKRYRRVMANSSETRDRIARAGLAPVEDVDVVHPGVDLDRFHGTAAGRAPRLLVAGRIMWQKRIELALDALRQVRETGSRIELVVAGAVDAKSVPYLEELRRQAHGLDVRFVIDPSDEVLAALYRSSRAVLFTPRNEDFGIVPLEAMASGTPVVAVDRGGPRETIVDGETGWLLPDDPIAWAAQIRRIEDQDEVTFARMSQAARRRASHFSWDAFVARIDEAMAQACRPQPRQSTLAMAANS